MKKKVFIVSLVLTLLTQTLAIGSNMDYIDVGVQISNRVYGDFPLKLTEVDIDPNKGMIIQSVGSDGKTYGAGDVVHDLLFIVRYTIPPEIKKLMTFEDDDDPFQYEIKQNTIFAALAKKFEESNADPDSITISNDQAEGAEQSLKISFGLPTTYFFPPAILQSRNLKVQASGIDEQAPQVQYILEGL